MGIVRAGNWPKSWLDKMGQHSLFKEIFITELELFVTLLIAKRVYSWGLPNEYAIFVRFLALAE